MLHGELFYPFGTVVVSGGWQHEGTFPFGMEYSVTLDGGTVEFSSAGRPPTVYNQTEQALPLEGKDGYAAEIEYFVECCRSGTAAGALPATGIGECGGVDAHLAGVTRKEREENTMFEPGVMFWAERDNLEMALSLGVKYGQLGIPGGMQLTARGGREMEGGAGSRRLHAGDGVRRL